MLNSIGIISGGSRVVVPSLIGLAPATANATLNELAIPYTYSGGTSSGATAQNNGLIATQSVAAGTVIERSAGISYYTYSYTPPACSPNYVQTGGNCRTGYVYTDTNCGYGSYTAAGDTKSDYILGFDCVVGQNKYRIVYGYCDGTVHHYGSYINAICPGS